MEKPRILSHAPSITTDIIQTFSHRQDAQQAFPYLSRFRKSYLTTVHVQARNGDNHEYFVLQQGRRRFLFDKEENQTPLANATDSQKKNRLSFTLVVPQQVMREKGLIAQNNELRKFESRRDARNFFRTTEQEGYFAMRGYTQDPKSIENNTDFIQPIPAVIVKDTSNNILFTLRDSNGANHDYRLSGMIAAPFTMGHSNPSDFGVWRKFLRHGLKLSMYREAAEETALQKDMKTFRVFPKINDHDYKVTLTGILRLRRHYDMQPFGVVYSENRPVDQVHAGVIFIATQRRKNVSLTLNGSSREIAQILPMSALEYQQILNEGNLIPASWNGPVLHEAFLSGRRKYTIKQQ